MLLVNSVDTKIISSLKSDDSIKINAVQYSKYLDKTFLIWRDHNEDGYGLTYISDSALIKQLNM